MGGNRWLQSALKPQNMKNAEQCKFNNHIRLYRISWVSVPKFKMSYNDMTIRYLGLFKDLQGLVNFTHMARNTFYNMHQGRFLQRGKGGSVS